MLKDPVPVITSGAIALILIILRPGVAAGVMTGLWHVLPTTVPVLKGFSATIAVSTIGLVACAVRFRSDFTPGATRPYIPFISLVAIIGIYELLQPRGTLQQWPAITAAIVAGFLILLIGAFGSTTRSLVVSFALAASVFGIGEIARIADGGQLHASVAAFGVNPIYGAHFLGIGAFALMACRFHGSIPSKPAIVGSCIMGAGLLATFSRGPILAAIIAILYLGLFAEKPGSRKSAARRISLLIGLSAGAAVVLGILNAGRGTDLNDPNTGDRTFLWKTTWDMIRSRPLAGVGPDTVETLRLPEWQHIPTSPHNIFLEMWASYGIVAFILLLMGVYAIFRNGNHWSKAAVIFTTISFSVSGDLASSFNLWISLAVCILIGHNGLLSGDPTNELSMAEGTPRGKPRVRPTHNQSALTPRRGKLHERPA